MIRIVPFGASAGFSDEPRVGMAYYTQGFTQSLLGAATLYSIVNKIDSGTVTGMGNIKYFAKGPGGAMFAQDDAGNILKETTPGAYDFAIVRSPGGNGCGLMGDQYGNLLYGNGASNNQLGKYDGTTWTDNYQSLSAAQHPMDTYEDLRVIANRENIACLFSDGTFNASAFTLPSSMNTIAISSGPTGILIGANIGYQGVLILWDGLSIRSKTPWKWTNGQILSITKYGENWIVETQREVLLTNGYTVKRLFGTFDDRLGFLSYNNSETRAQGIALAGDILIFPINSVQGGRIKLGVYLHHIPTAAWDFIPLATGNTINASINSVFIDISFNNRILIGYSDAALSKNYIAALTNTPPARAVYIPEPIGVGRIHYQRVFFGPTDKVAMAVVLNLGILNSITAPATQTFDVALKLYDFKRQLWGVSSTNASIAGNDKLQVDGTSSSNYKAQVGDEVTVLEGLNAGQVAHISSIANAGTSTETWTLDTTFPNQTESAMTLSVQPFVLIEKKSFTALSELKNIFFNCEQKGVKGKQFLAKFVIDNIGTNLQLEHQLSYFVFDDIGYDQT